MAIRIKHLLSRGVPEKNAQSLHTIILKPYVTVMRFSAKNVEK